MKIRTQNRFWQALFFAVMAAAFAGFWIVFHLEQHGGPPMSWFGFMGALLASLVLFLWPAFKQLWTVIKSVYGFRPVEHTRSKTRRIARE